MGTKQSVKVKEVKEVRDDFFDEMVKDLEEQRMEEEQDYLEEMAFDTKRIKIVLHSDIREKALPCSLAETEDKRIAMGDGDGNISISSYDIPNKKWKKNIYKKKAHLANVNSLCALSSNRLLSGSSDETVKVWSVS